MSGGVCAVAGCAKLAEGRGWCMTHYMRWYRTGDLGRGRRDHSPICSVDGCSLSYKCRGFCDLHYQRWSRTGQTSLIGRRHLDREPDLGGVWSLT